MRLFSETFLQHLFSKSKLPDHSLSAHCTSGERKYTLIHPPFTHGRYRETTLRYRRMNKQTTNKHRLRPNKHHSFFSFLVLRSRKEAFEGILVWLFEYDCFQDLFMRVLNPSGPPDDVEVGGNVSVGLKVILLSCTPKYIVVQTSSFFSPRRLLHRRRFLLLVLGNLRILRSKPPTNKNWLNRIAGKSLVSPGLFAHEKDTPTLVGRSSTKLTPYAQALVTHIPYS